MRRVGRAALGCALGAAIAACGGTSGDGDDDDDAPDAAGPDAGGEVLPPGDCRELMTAAGVTWTEGPASPGIADPVTVDDPFAALPYRYIEAGEPRTTMLADCELAGVLVRIAPLLRGRGVVQVVDYGVYNYRCIGNEGTPPDCPQGISEHAFGRAIDVAAYALDDGTSYVVDDDWVIDGEDEETCAAPREPGADQWLHEILCAQVASGVWGVALTPNYNAAHRNHFHLDLGDGDGDPFVH